MNWFEFKENGLHPGESYYRRLTTLKKVSHRHLFEREEASISHGPPRVIVSHVYVRDKYDGPYPHIALNNPLIIPPVVTKKYEQLFLIVCAMLLQTYKVRKRS